MKCPNCQAENPKDSEYCRKCGQQMTYQKRPSSGSFNREQRDVGNVPSIPPDYLKDGYFNKEGIIFRQIIVEWSKRLAHAFHHSRPQLKTSQLRNFLGFLKKQEKRLDAGIPFSSLKGNILKMDSYTENAVKKKIAPVIFKNFVRRNVDFALMNEKSFRAFVTHFECIVGYYPETR